MLAAAGGRTWCPRTRRYLCKPTWRKNTTSRAVGTSRGRHGRRHHPGLRPRFRACIGAGPSPSAGRRERRRCAACHHRVGPARRAAGFPAVLGRRASQHARHRQLGPCGADRPHCRRDRGHPGRLRRGDAAEPCLAGDCRAVRHARGTASRPHRPGHRPGAGYGPGHGRGATPLARGAVRRRFPRSAHGPARVLYRPLARGSPVRADHRGARPGPPARPVAARFERLQRTDGRPARPAVRVRAPLQPGQHAPGAGPVPLGLPLVRDPRPPPRHGRGRGGLRGHR